MKHNVGDKVRIKSKEWWDKQPKNKWGSIKFKESFTESMTIYCGKECTIEEVGHSAYFIDIDNGTFKWTDEMFDYSYTPEK